jgi:hypothetical protein
MQDSPYPLWIAHEDVGREGLFEVNPLHGGEPRRTLPCSDSHRQREESPRA